MTTLRDLRDREMTLEELVRTAEGLLAELGGEVADGRVTAIPDARTIRYYQTSGILSKPARYDGRRAVYGFQHLVQLVSVKKLQAEGYPLSVIQKALLGRSTRELEEKIAGLLPSPRAVRRHDFGSQRRFRECVSVDPADGVTLVLDKSRFADPEKVLSDIASVVKKHLEGKS